MPAALPRSSAAATLPILFVGIGGAGSNIVERMAATPGPGERFACINSCAESLARRKLEQKLHIEVSAPPGDWLAAGELQPELLFHARETIAAHHGLAAMAQRDQIERLFAGIGTVVLIAGLAGATGGGMILEIAAIARQAGFIPAVVGMMPFEFEGTTRNRYAAEKARRIKTSYGKRVQLVEAETMIHSLPKESSLGAVLQVLDEHAIRSARELIDSWVA